jgi:hypothetical protein
MSMDNPLWGSPRIHGELLKLGFGVAKCMAKRREPADLSPKPRGHAIDGPPQLDIK